MTPCQKHTQVTDSQALIRSAIHRRSATKERGGALAGADPNSKQHCRKRHTMVSGPKVMIFVVLLCAIWCWRKISGAIPETPRKLELESVEIFGEQYLRHTSSPSSTAGGSLMLPKSDRRSWQILLNGAKGRFKCMPYYAVPIVLRSCGVVVTTKGLSFSTGLIDRRIADQGTYPKRK